MLLTAVAIRFDSHGLGLSDQQERRHDNASTSNPQRSRPPASSHVITLLVFTVQVVSYRPKGSELLFEGI